MASRIDAILRDKDEAGSCAWCGVERRYHFGATLDRIDRYPDTTIVKCFGWVDPQDAASMCPVRNVPDSDCAQMAVGHDPENED